MILNLNLILKIKLTNSIYRTLTIILQLMILQYPCNKKNTSADISRLIFIFHGGRAKKRVYSMGGWNIIYKCTLLNNCRAKKNSIFHGWVEYYLQMHSQKKIAATQLLVKNRAKPLKERRFCVQRHI